MNFANAPTFSVLFWIRFISKGVNNLFKSAKCVFLLEIHTPLWEMLLKAVKLAQLVWRLLLVHEVASASPVRSNALVKIECACQSFGQGAHC